VLAGSEEQGAWTVRHLDGRRLGRYNDVAPTADERIRGVCRTTAFFSSEFLRRMPRGRWHHPDEIDGGHRRRHSVIPEELAERARNVLAV